MEGTEKETKYSDCGNIKMKVFVTVTNTGWIHKNTADFLLKIQQDRRYKIIIWLSKENPYENNLNILAREFIKNGYDYWLQIDSDNVPINNPLDLVEYNKDIVIFPYPQWKYEGIKGEYPIVWLSMDDEGEGFKEHKDFSGFQRIDAGGSGCMLIAQRVIKKIDWPFKRTHDKYGRVDIGVDFNFGRIAKEYGFEMWAHYGYPTRHFKEIELVEVQEAFESYYRKKYAKKESSGKDLVFYCGDTREKWDGETHLERGIAGSEEAIIYLTPELVKLGWNVTVYNNCEKEKKINGVIWKPFREWNNFDKQDITIIWRRPEVARQFINSRVFIDLYDVGYPEQLQNIAFEKVFVKSNFHKSLYTQIPDNKFLVVPCGIDIEQFKDVEKDPYLLINTSAPDRSLGTLLKLFRRIKQQIPEAKLVWAYGWSLFDSLYENDKRMMDWKQEIIQAMEELEVINLDRVTHQEIAEWYGKATIFAYPTQFSEAYCISALKAQAAGAIPVTVDYGALNETVQSGVKIHLDKGGERDYDYGIPKEKEDEWVTETIKMLRKPILIDRSKFRNQTWEKVAQEWNKQFNG